MLQPLLILSKWAPEEKGLDQVRSPEEFSVFMSGLVRSRLGRVLSSALTRLDQQMVTEWYWAFQGACAPFLATHPESLDRYMVLIYLYARDVNMEVRNLGQLANVLQAMVLSTV